MSAASTGVPISLSSPWGKVALIISLILMGLSQEKGIVVATGASSTYFDVRMDASPKKAEDYARTTTAYNGPDAYVREIRLLDLDPTIHHHMILYYTPPGKADRLFFVWSHAAPGYKLPEDSGLLLEHGSTFTLETHYLTPRTHDRNGFRLMLTSQRPLRIARIGSLEVPPAKFGSIPPRTRASTVRTSCRVVNKRSAVHAVMIHTHKKGSKVRVMKRNPQTGQSTQLFSGNPQKPQTFNPIQPVELRAGNDLMVECTYDTRKSEEWTRYGVGKDEMCGTYFIYIGDEPFDCRPVEPQKERTYPSETVAQFGQNWPGPMWMPQQAPIFFGGNLRSSNGIVVQRRPAVLPRVIYYPQYPIAVPVVPVQPVPNGIVIG